MSTSETKPRLESVVSSFERSGRKCVGTRITNIKRQLPRLSRRSRV